MIFFCFYDLINKSNKTFMVESIKEDNNPIFSKINLMGLAGVGKTSMRSVIFSDCTPRDTMVIGYTYEVAEIKLNFMNASLCLFDCGGQYEYIKKYLSSKREYVFSNTEVLIFVAEAIPEVKKQQQKINNFQQSKPENEEDRSDLKYFEDCVNALDEISPNAEIVVLIHKMDKVKTTEKSFIYSKRQKEFLARSKGFKVTFFATSIFESSLYKAWTQIVSRYLIKDSKKIKEILSSLVQSCNSVEAVLLEKKTLLIVNYYSHSNGEDFIDEEKYEEISEIIKNFKLSCLRSGKKLENLDIKTKNIYIFLKEFNSSLYILLVARNQTSMMLGGKSVSSNICDLLFKTNVDLARKSYQGLFEKKGNQ